MTPRDDQRLKELTPLICAQTVLVRRHLSEVTRFERSHVANGARLAVDEASW
jgi:hypothetical protein